ncbi:MAG: 30S ribosome-binding factor RbfA [Thermodesulfobacteria bacterium]|nr:30S ribosome-binding factor RbfA [Thermodesulfobacteriota bacterium]
MRYRAEKLASLIQREITDIIMNELRDPVFKQFISITEVKLEADLRKAIVYFRVYGGDEKQVEKALSKAKGYIKKLLGERIVVKFMPDIEFRLDDRVEKEKRLEELFAKIAKSKEK